MQGGFYFKICLFFYCFHWECFGSAFEKKSPLHSLILVCTFIDFEKKIPPARLFCPARLMFFKNFSTCTFIWSCTSIRYTRVYNKLTFGVKNLLARYSWMQITSLDCFIIVGLGQYLQDTLSSSGVASIGANLYSFIDDDFCCWACM